MPAVSEAGQGYVACALNKGNAVVGQGPIWIHWTL